MLVNASNLDALRAGFSTAFQGGVGQAASQHQQVATIVPTTTKETKFGWLGKVPGVREWVGPRAVQNLTQHDYTIREKPWELTLAVDRDDVETDNLGIYTPLFTEMGEATMAFWDTLVFDALKAGFTSACYDGQYFFDTDHPVIGADGATVSVANTDGGSGAPWFLIDATRALKPILLQRRKDFEFVAKDKLTDDNVFELREFRYGADARGNVGYGFWQFAWGSKQPLSATAYGTARAALQGMKADGGRPIGVRPNLLVVPPSLESAARKIVNSSVGEAGQTNEWQGTAQLLVSPWLA